MHVAGTGKQQAGQFDEEIFQLLFNALAANTHSIECVCVCVQLPGGRTQREGTDAAAIDMTVRQQCG